MYVYFQPHFLFVYLFNKLLLNLDHGNFIENTQNERMKHKQNYTECFLVRDVVLATNNKTSVIVVSKSKIQSKG